MPAAFTIDRVRTIDLDHDQLLILSEQRGSRIQVLFGGLWLTEEGSLQDHFVTTGQWLRLEARGRAVAEALAPTRVRIVEPARRIRQAWQQASLRWRSLVDAWAARTVAALLALVLSVGAAELTARGFLGGVQGAQADILSRAPVHSPET